jgi:hypothetical protein
MNTGQMLLVIGALALLSLLALSINQMVVGQTKVMLDSEASLNAVSIAQSLLDEIQTKYFDLAVVPNPPGSSPLRIFDNQVSLFTDYSGFGPSHSEASAVPLPDSVSPFKSIAGYNDVDDYNGYIRIENNALMTGFRDSVAVYYVLESDPNTKSNTQTFFKRIDVTVMNPSMKTPLTVSDVAVYRRFF